MVSFQESDEWPTNKAFNRAVVFKCQEPTQKKNVFKALNACFLKYLNLLVEPFVSLKKSDWIS
jgi:hypothetical protein